MNCCKHCGNIMTWAEVRRQYGRLIQKKGRPPEQARELSPLCQKCVTGLFPANKCNKLPFKKQEEGNAYENH